MYLLDTNICIAIIKGNENVVSHFHKKHESCYLATLVLAELYKGVYCSSKVERNLDNLQRFASLLPIIDFDEKAAIEFGIMNCIQINHGSKEYISSFLLLEKTQNVVPHGLIVTITTTTTMSFTVFS
jgi:predicted nucleic acid-binding protein